VTGKRGCHKNTLSQNIEGTSTAIRKVKSLEENRAIIKRNCPAVRNAIRNGFPIALPSFSRYVQQYRELLPILLISRPDADSRHSETSILPPSLHSCCHRIFLRYGETYRKSVQRIRRHTARCIIPIAISDNGCYYFTNYQNQINTKNCIFHCIVHMFPGKLITTSCK